MTSLPPPPVSLRSSVKVPSGLRHSCTWKSAPSMIRSKPLSPTKGESLIAPRLSTLIAKPQIPPRPTAGSQPPRRVVSGAIERVPESPELEVDTRLMQLPKRPSATTDQVQPTVVTAVYLLGSPAVS